MADAPKELSGEIALHHPNCGSAFQFQHYEEAQNINYFQCPRCGLALAVQAFFIQPESALSETLPVSSDVINNDTITEPAIEPIDESNAPQPKPKKIKKREPDHIK